MDIIKTSTEILMDFTNAKRQAGRLEEAARAIRVEALRMEDCRRSVCGAWSGDNALRYTSKMGHVSGDLERIANNLDKAAAVLRKNAKALFDAEMEAIRLAEARK
jgi:uncharacterized protein YukE